MKKIIFILLILFIYCNSFSQKWNWAQKIGNIKSDKATCVKTDDSGYIYVAGYFSDHINLGTNQLLLNYTANSFSKEIYIAKFDSLGYCYWAKSGGQYWDDRILGMDVDSAGNVVVTGTFWEGSGIIMDTVNITGSAYGYGDQCFIYKLDRNGNVLWGNFVCSDFSDDQGLDVATDKQGNSYVVGFMSGTDLYCGGNTVTATNANTGAHLQAYWLAKINSNGVFQWAKTFGSLPWDPTHNKYIERDIAVCVDNKGGVYVTGGYDLSRPFGTTTLTTSGGYDIFVLKYDDAGNFIWVTNGGSRKDDWSNGICSDKNGFIYITGEHRDSLIMDTIIIKNYDGRDAFVIKMDPTTGKPIWGKHAGSDKGSERGNDIVADDKCNVYVCGDIDGGAKFGDKILTPTGKSIEAFVARISPEGKWRWVATGGGIDSNDRSNAIAKGRNGQLYTCGFFKSPANYDTSNLISTGKSDGFLAQLYDSMANSLSPFDLHSPNDSIICKGESITLIIPDNAYFDYNPKTDASYTTANHQLVFSPNSTTTYTLIALGKEQCPSYDTISFTIHIAPDPIANFFINPQPALITNPVLNLSNQTINGSTYQWIYNNAVFATTNDAQYTAASEGNYCFSLVAYSNEQCVDTITKCGDVIKLQEVYLASVFTPNADGVNDVFKVSITNLNLTEINDFSMIIANRFGEEIYHSKNIMDGWNGKYANGELADIGTYIYYVTLKMPNGKQIMKKGDIALIR
jgi:gliding motility-associated-like protein